MPRNNTIEGNDREPKWVRINEYNKEKYDRVHLCLPKGTRDNIKAKQEERGEKPNITGFIYTAIKKELNS